MAFFSKYSSVPLKELASFQNGFGFYKDGYASEGLLAIDLFNVSQEGKLRFSGRDKYVSLEIAQKRKKFILEKGDLVIVMTDMTQDLGILGRCAIIDRSDTYVLNQRIGRLVPFGDSVDTRYLSYAINSPQCRLRLHTLVKGVAQKYVNTGDITDNLIPVPDLPTQGRIASILSAYDDLIENNTRRIAILEEMARRIYEEWFVRFRFPGHEQVKMVETELGLIPEGWRLGCLGDIVENIRKATRPGEHLATRRYVPIDCIGKRTLVLSESNDYTEAQSSLVLFEKGDILFGAMRPYFHKVAIAPFAGVTRTTCFVLRPWDMKLQAYSALTMFSDSVVAYASAHIQGATIPYAVWDGSLANYKVAIPPESILGAFEETVRPMLTWLQQVMFRQENLRTTRDLLLPKLISGELDVSTFPEPEAIAA